jgi:hypothetical protein
MTSNWHLHFGWLIGVLILDLVGFVGVHAWVQEHDARVVAEAQAKVSETAIKTLQQEIADNDAKAQQQIVTLQMMIRQVKTPVQVVAALPQVLPQPLPVAPTVLPNQSIVLPAPDVLPLFQDLAQGKQDSVSLAACKSDLTAETAIAVQKQDEIVALKKKPKFWKSVTHDLKIIGITAATVALILR